MPQDEPASMAVTDAGGEISATVAETNKMRASLGLPPLSEGKPDSKEEQAIANSRELAETQRKERDEDAMREKLDAARRQRMLNQKLGGKGLGEQLAGEEMDSAAAWVSKSRRQEEDRKSRPKVSKGRKGRSTLQRNAERYDQMDAEEQEASQVAGALIGHSTEDFTAGESVTLTLADRGILGEDGQSLEDGDAMLENVNMTDDWRREHNKELARGPAVDVESRNILNKYDEEKERVTVRLDAAGGVDEAKLKKLAAIKQRLQMSAAGPVQHHDLGGAAGASAPQLKTGADYQTAEEAAEVAAAAATFRKVGDSSGKKKKMRRKKKAEVDDSALDLDALAAEEESLFFTFGESNSEMWEKGGVRHMGERGLESEFC